MNRRRRRELNARYGPDDRFDRGGCYGLALVLVCAAAFVVVVVLVIRAI